MAVTAAKEAELAQVRAQERAEIESIPLKSQTLDSLERAKGFVQTGQSDQALRLLDILIRLERASLRQIASSEYYRKRNGS